MYDDVVVTAVESTFDLEIVSTPASSFELMSSSFPSTVGNTVKMNEIVVFQWNSTFLSDRTDNLTVEIETNAGAIVEILNFTMTVGDHLRIVGYQWEKQNDRYTGALQNVYKPFSDFLL